VLLLETWGLRPTEAADGASALTALSSASAEGDPFYVAIVDLRMPGMDGETLGRAVRADSSLRETRMVMCDSLGSSASVHRWRDLGFLSTVTMPVRRKELREALEEACRGKSREAPQEAQRPATSASPRFGQARVLVAEDNVTNRQVAVGILRRLGLHADAAANGEEAIRALESLPYDLVLMDVQMPELDGLEATRRIRDVGSRAQNRNVPIIAMTAHAMQGDKEKCLEAGMNGYLAKPIEIPALLEALERWLSPSGEGQPLETGRTSATAAVAVGAGAGPVFDRAAVLERVSHDEESAQAVIGVFLDDLPVQVAKLKQHVEAGDARQAERQAHKIRGACDVVGGVALSALAAAMEQAGRSGDLVGISARMPELDAQVEALERAMQQGT
jgi:CheY-like chemotaxis protein/HPt (histidine-containing phosphotransfer) domain-containing protein